MRMLRATMLTKIHFVKNRIRKRLKSASAFNALIFVTCFCVDDLMIMNIIFVVIY
jgi:hypothetical protein